MILFQQHLDNTGGVFSKQKIYYFFRFREISRPLLNIILGVWCGVGQGKKISTIELADRSEKCQTVSLLQLFTCLAWVPKWILKRRFLEIIVIYILNFNICFSYLFVLYYGFANFTIHKIIFRSTKISEMIIVILKVKIIVEWDSILIFTRKKKSVQESVETM